MSVNSAGFLPSGGLIELSIISVIAGASVLGIIFREEYLKKLALSSLEKISKDVGGIILKNSSDSEWLGRIMEKVLKGVTNQLFYSLTLIQSPPSISFPVVLKSIQDDGLMNMGYVELQRTVDNEIRSTYFTFFAFQGNWDIQGRITIRPKSLIDYEDIFETSGLKKITGNETISGFEKKFEVMASYEEMAIDLVGPDLQEALVKCRNSYPFNSLSRQGNSSCQGKCR